MQRHATRDYGSSDYDERGYRSAPSDRDYGRNDYDRNDYGRDSGNDYGRNDYGRESYGSGDYGSRSGDGRRFRDRDYDRGSRGYAMSREDEDRMTGRRGFDRGYGGPSVGREYGTERGGYEPRYQDYQGRPDYGRSDDAMNRPYGADGRSEYGPGYGRRDRAYNQGTYGRDYGMSRGNDQGYGGTRGSMPGYADRSAYDRGSRQTGGTQQMESYAGRAPKGYQRSSERTTEDVCERLMWNDELDPSDIQVKADNGEVTLEGTVESRYAKRMAEDLAESATGVRDVHNRLRIRQRDTDEEQPNESGQQSGTSATKGKKSS